MTDLATIRIPVDSSDMLQAVKDSKSLERGIKMLVDSFDSGAIGSKQFESGLSQIRKEFNDLFTSYQQATSRVRGFASALIESKSATDAATASEQALTAATQKAETAFALANQKAKEELELNRSRAETAFALGMQRAREADIAVAAADKQAQAEARLTQELIKRRNAQEQAAAQKAQDFQSQIGDNLGLGAQGISAGASASTIEGELERLKTKYDSTYAASKLFEAQSKELSFAMLNQAGNADTLKNEMDKLQAEYTAFSAGTANITNRFVQQAAAVDQSRRGVNNWSLLVQQSGYQAGDFLVQLQSGTNGFVAFGQQATQLVGILPLFATELGLSAVALGGITLGLSIAIPLFTALGAYLMRTSEASRKTKDELSDLDSAIKGIDDSLKKWLQTKQAAAQGVTVEELFGGTKLADAQKELEVAQKALDKFNEQKAMRNVGSGTPGMAAGQALADWFLGSQKEADLATAEQAVTDATKRVADLQAMQDEKRSKAYRDQFNLLQEDLNMQIAIAKFGSDSAEVKNLELQQSLDQYNRQIDAQIESKEITAEQGLGLKYINQTLQDNLRIAQSAAVVANNQRSADAARAQERLAAEAEYQSRVNEALAKDQYWSDQAKAAERQQAAVQYIMENLSLLAAKKDSEGFNTAMEAALAAGVHFSQVDLSSVVAMAAKNGWSLVGALRAAWAASQGGPVVKANPNAGPAFEGGGRMGKTSAPYIAPALTLEETIKKNLDKGGGAAKDTQTAIEKLQEQLAVEKELLGTSEAYQRVRQALGDDFKTTSPEVIAGLVQQATETERLIALEEQRKQIMETVKSSVENALMSMVDGTQSVKDAFKSMAAEIIKELYRIYVVQKIVGAVTGAFEGGVGFFSAPATGSFGLPFGGAFASGGPIDPSKAYLVGEKGPELVIPRSSGTVVNANQTAKAMGGGGSNAVTVNNNITVTGSDAAMVRAEVAKMIPQITNATKAAVIDARLRGGQMKQAFR